MEAQRSENSPKRECLLTAAGSQEVNGRYTQTSEEDLFYKKKYTAGDAPGIVYIITLESLPELGEDFEVAWALQSHDTDSDDVVTFYATPCDDPESQGFPLRGWITVSGLNPVPRIFPRPMQLPRDRTSNLDIIEENMERDFIIEPFWTNDYKPDASEKEIQSIFHDWDEFGEDDEDEDWRDLDCEEPSSEGDDSDYGEIELPEDIMANFQDGTFVHKLPQVDTSNLDEPPEIVSPRGVGSDMDSDTSEDFTVIRHDCNKESLDQSETPAIPSISNQGDEKEEIKEEKKGSGEKFNLPSQAQMRSGICIDNLDNSEETVDLKNPNLAYARSLGTEGEITIVDFRTEPPTITGAPIGSLVTRPERVSLGKHEEVDYRVISPPYKPLIAPPKDPFISAITRTGMNPVDVDLISAVVQQEVKSTRQRGKNPIYDPSRRNSQRNRQVKSSQIGGTPIDKEGVSDDEKDEKLDEVVGETSTQTSTAMEVKTDIISAPPQEKSRDSEREKLEEEMHQLKTKMRKCDRLSKLRKRGRTLTKEQQETLVHKSKYQKRIEELRRLLGSDIGRS